MAGADLPTGKTAADDPQPTGSAASVDVSKFLPKQWGAWLKSDVMISTQAAHSHLHDAGAATAKALDECTVLGGVLRDRISKTAALLAK